SAHRAALRRGAQARPGGTGRGARHDPGAPRQQAAHRLPRLRARRRGRPGRHGQRPVAARRRPRGPDRRAGPQPRAGPARRPRRDRGRRTDRSRRSGGEPMTTGEKILVTRRGSLGLVTLNRAKERNPLDHESAAGLRDALRDLFADPQVRSVAVTGAGDAFCAGGDLRQMGKLAEGDVEDAYMWPRAIVDLHRLMLEAPKPVIAAVQGPAYAGGMGHASLATPRSRSAMPEVRIGLFPMIIVAHLSRSLPRKRLLEMMLTGESIDADEAHRLGFVSKVYPDHDGLMAGLDDYARK